MQSTLLCSLNLMLSTSTRLLFLGLLVLIGSHSSHSAAINPDQVISPIRIGIYDSEMDARTSMLVKLTITNLKQIFDGSWEIKKLNSSDLDKAIKDEAIDLVFLPADQFVIAERFYNLQALASQKLPGSDSPQKVVGTIVLAKHHRILELEDLVGKRIGVPHNANYLKILLQNTLRRRDIDPKNITFVRMKAMSQEASSLKMDSDNLDAIVLGACEFSRNQIAEKDALLHPVGVIPDPEFPCLSSTLSSPGFVFAGINSVTQATLLRFRAALLIQPSNIYGSWSPVADMQEVSTILLEEEVPRFIAREQWRWDKFFFDNWPYFLLVFSALIGMLCHGVIVEFMVRKRTQELIRSTSEKVALQAKFENLEKAGIVGQLSSMVAHELKQPLATIHNYADGLNRLTKKSETLNREILIDTLTRIDEAGRNAVQIIDHVRNYAKQRDRQLEMFDFTSLATETITAMQSLFRAANVELLLEMKAVGAILGNKLEIQLLLRNLLKNSLEAAQHVKNPKVTVQIFSEQNQIATPGIILKISDNGPILDQKQLEALSKPLVSTKEQGLGLGLAIVRRIVENHYGSIHFQPIATGGLCVVVYLPCAEIKNK